VDFSLISALNSIAKSSAIHVVATAEFLVAASPTQRPGNACLHISRRHDHLHDDVSCTMSPEAIGILIQQLQHRSAACDVPDSHTRHIKSLAGIAVEDVGQEPIPVLRKRTDAVNQETDFSRRWQCRRHWRSRCFRLRKLPAN
jgi:hypothetical protein